MIVCEGNGYEGSGEHSAKKMEQRDSGKEILTTKDTKSTKVEEPGIRG